MFTIIGLPAFDSNYLWLIHNDCNAWAVDPGDADVIRHYLDTQALTLTGILITHHHADHIGGLSALKKAYPQATVIGPCVEKIAGLEIDAQHGASYPLTGLNDADGKPMSALCMAVPGHTAGHVAFYLAPSAALHNTPRLFCGDTLFAAGCGRLFEGTPAQLHDSLHRLTQLPAHTLAYCAHEYTVSNLAFAAAVEPNNAAIQARTALVKAQRDAGEPTVPFVLGDEQHSNVFLRTHTPDVQASVSAHAGLLLSNSVDVFTELRMWKNRF